MADFEQIESWLSALVNQLQPAERRKMLQQLAAEIRRHQQQNIRMQRDPNGNAYVPRRVSARAKKGRIKRQMFSKLRTGKYLKARAEANSATIEFIGQVQKIARVHHYGLRDKVSRHGPEVRYPARRLLGVNEEIRMITLNTVVNFISSN